MKRDEDMDARVAFQRLKPISTELMDRRNDAQGARKALVAMRDGLLQVPPDGLQVCHELVLFPLHLILEAVLARRMASEKGKEAPGFDDMRCAIHEGVAEEVYACYRAVLECTWCEGREALQQALARTAGVATVCQKSDSEIVRTLGLRCLSALILHLRNSPRSRDLHAYLCEQATAPALGHLLSIPVSYAKSEIHAGSKGSKSVLQIAWSTLQEWLEFVDDPDAIAFFVPGTASGLFLTLQRAGSLGPTTASAGGQAVVEAISALSTLLQVVLADAHCRSALEDLAIQQNAETGLDVVQQLNEIVKVGRQGAQKSAGGVTDLEECDMNKNSESTSLRCVRDRQWSSRTSQKLGDMAKQTVPVLLHHAQASVRGALIKLSTTVLCECTIAFSTCREVFVRCLLILFQDPSEAVARHAQKTLRATMFHSNPCLTTDKIVSSMLQKALTDLPPAGDPDPSCLEENLKLISSCMEALGPEPLISTFFASEDTRSQTLDLLSGCFCLEGNHRAALGTSWQAGHNESASRLQLLGTSFGHVSGISLFEVHQQPLPRFAQGMTYLSNASLYKYAATAVRLLGRAAAAIDRHGSELAGLLGCARRKVVFILEARGPGWQRDAASWFLLINELLYGASTVWNTNKGYGRSAPPDWMPATTDVLISQITQIMELYAQPELLNLPTASNEARGFGFREAADNCIMLRPLLEGVGIFAGCLGPYFADHDARLLPAAICPLVERVADASGLVADSAMISILAVCRHCGYKNPSEMLAKNADYIVDELCKQLREPSAYPQSCKLLTVVLRSQDDTSTMFPLVAEPVRLASLILTPTARQGSKAVSNHALTALLEAMKATVREGKKVQECIKLESEDLLVSADEENNAPVQAPISLDLADSNSESVKEFFNKYHQAKENETGDSVDSNLEACQDLLAKWRKRLENIAAILDTAVETVGPLFASASLSTKVLAMDCALETLYAAKFYDQAIDCIESLAERFTSDHTKDLDMPRRKLLPCLAQLWPDLVQSLNEGQGSSIEMSLRTLLEMVLLSRGTFLARRWIQDAWPACLRLMDCGGHVESAGLLHADYLAVRQRKQDPVSALHVEKVQTHVLSMVDAIATGTSASKVLIPENLGKMVIDLLQYGTLPFSLHVQTQCINTLSKLALVDCAKVVSALKEAASSGEDCCSSAFHNKSASSSELQYIPTGSNPDRRASVAKLVLSSLQGPISAQ